MAFIPVPLTAQCNIRGTYIGEQVENTLYVRSNTAWSAVTLQILADQLLAWYDTSVLPLLSASYTLREVYAVDLASVTGPTATSTPIGVRVGGTSGDGMPGSVALCVSFRTGARGRSFRGRNYVPGVVEANVSNNVISATWSESVVLAYQQLLIPDEYLPVSQEWVVVSRYANNQPRAQGIATPVTQVLVVDNFVDSQRRRLPGRGR